MEVSKINEFEGGYRFECPIQIVESKDLNKEVIDNIVDNAGAKSPNF